MMEGRLLSVAIMGEDRGRLSDCATCGEHGGKLELNGEINQARHMCIHILLYQRINFPHLTEFMYFCSACFATCLCPCASASATFLPSVLYLVSHGECQRCTSDSGAVSYGSQHQAGWSQELTGERLQEGGCRLHGFGGCRVGRRVDG